MNEHIENEWFHVRYSGETPEIALYSSFFYLTQDNDGPQLTLNSEDRRYLLTAARARYCEIIFRDMLSENRNTPIYRGLLRSICNWRRYKRFCERHEIDWRDLRADVANQLTCFLQNEVEEWEKGSSEASTINCSIDDLRSFAMELGVSLEDIYENMGEICVKV